MDSANRLSKTELTQLKIDLAAAFRLAAQFNWHESVGNHFSAAISDDGKQFLMNPKWMHFAEIRSIDLLSLDADKPVTTSNEHETALVDKSAWCLHGEIHRSNPKAKVVLHLHPPYVSALACLKDPTLYPIDQNSARFFGIKIDSSFGGMADQPEEAKRISKALLRNNALIMQNHGVTVIGETVAQAFEDMYFLERAAKTLMLAYASGQPLNVMSDKLARETKQSWGSYRGAANMHFDYLKRKLDITDSSYRN
ncbi:MAG: class II aldolase/adducin family protein [Kangiellaceae bacterium]